MSEHLDPAAVAAFDDLAGAPRRRAADHLARCAACRGALAVGDPSRLFSALGTVAPPAAALARLEARLAAALPPRRATAGRRLAARRLGPVAASAVLALALGALLITGQVAIEPDAGTRAVAASPRTPAGGMWHAVDAAGGIRLIDSPEHAQVVELSVGATQVVMIFDDGVDL